MSAEHLQRALLAFFDREQRSLPWRESRDPYRIWISEVMLQQTQVATVLPYYRAFLEAFPNVAALAAAGEEQVLARWSGLGYYRRARQLHAAARAIIAAGLPQDAEGWRQLPGIGPYTAAAIASQAFGEKVPLLDGNVERVLSRRLALAEDPKRRPTRDLLLAAAAELLDDERPGDSNQALMELGATVCRPRQPLCLLCPLAEGCRGRAEPERYPRPRQVRDSEKLEMTLAIVGRGAEILFFRRPKDAPFLADLWELPGIEGTATPKSAAAALNRRYGGVFTLHQEQKRFRHAITYRRLEVKVYAATWQPGAAPSREPRWVKPAERATLGLSSMFEKALRP